MKLLSRPFVSLTIKLLLILTSIPFVSHRTNMHLEYWTTLDACNQTTVEAFDDPSLMI